MPLGNAEHGGGRFQNNGAERGRHRSNAQRRHQQPAAVHHRRCASAARAALELHAHLRAGTSYILLPGTEEGSLGQI